MKIWNQVRQVLPNCPLGIGVGGRPCHPHPPPSIHLGYFWIESPQPTGSRVSLVSVSESGSQNLQFTVEYKIDHISKLKITQKKNSKTKQSVLEHCTSLERTFFFWSVKNTLNKFVNKIDYNSKNKNRKIDFSCVSEHCVSFWTKK